MTQFERFKAMNLDEAVGWLDEYGLFDSSPWMKWFDQKYCKNCPSIKCKYEDGIRQFPASWCELYDKCKFFPDMPDVPDNKDIIRMWLESEEE